MAEGRNHLTTSTFLANDRSKVMKIIKEMVELVSIAHGLNVPLQYKTEIVGIVKKKGKKKLRGVRSEKRWRRLLR